MKGNWYKRLGALASIAGILGVVHLWINNDRPTDHNTVDGIQIKDDAEISGGNFAGGDNNFYYNSGGNAELIALLEARAKVINDSLSRKYHYEENVQKYLKHFNEIHPQVIKALKNDHDVLAHELIGRIQVISVLLEANERDKRNKALDIDVEYLTEVNPDETYGKLSSKYLTGNFNKSNDLGELYEWQKKAMERGISEQLMISKDYLE